MNNELALVVAKDTGEVSTVPAVVEAKENALQAAAMIGIVSSPALQQKAVQAIAAVKAVLSAVESARVKVKDPYLATCQRIDQRAREFKADLAAEELRLNTAVGNYVMEQAEIARKANEARQAELRRIADEEAAEKARVEAEARRIESERLAEERRIAAEALRKQQEADEARRKLEDAAAEQRRKAKEEEDRLNRESAEANTKKERERLAKIQAENALKQAKIEAENARKQAEIDRQQALERAETARITAENEAKAEAERVRLEAERLRIEGIANVEREIAGPEVAPAMAKGQKSTVEKDFEVFDIHVLAKCHPVFVKIEVRRQEIMDAINKHGMEKIAGVRIIETVKTRVKSAKAIEVESQRLL